MNPQEEDRIVTALREASNHVVAGVSERVALCRAAARLLGWARLTKTKSAALDYGYRLALHRKVWLRQAEGARGPYPYGNPRPISRYAEDDLQALAREAIGRTATPADDAEGAFILARYLGFTSVPSADLAILAAAVGKAKSITEGS